MLRTLMHAKLHGARVTDHNLDYQGSITIDRELLDAVGILPHERVQVVDKNNGARFETYVFEGPRGGGDICVNGAAARLVARGDELIIIAYGQFTDDEAVRHRPRIAILGAHNRVVELGTELDAPAKLNLFLEVLARRPDGYHEIDSVFVAIDLKDRLRLERAPSISLEVTGEEVPKGPANLAWKAAEALGVGARIRLEKRIPVGSGLGGGSSDAAAVLLGLDRLYGMGLGPDGLLDAARRLGADVPFFLKKGLARCTGTGDCVQPLPPGPPRRFLLACPSLPLETRRVYEALGPGLTGKRETATVFLQKYLAPASGPVPCFNRLQEVAERLEPRLREVRQMAESLHGAAFTMTGSGSAYFAGVPPGAPEDGKFETAAGIRVRVTTVAT